VRSKLGALGPHPTAAARTNQELIMADCEAIEGKGTFHH
jgi:hypothetical protein